MFAWLIFPIFAIFLLTRIFPYPGNSVPLGYDPGLYLYLFEKYSQIPLTDFTSLPAWLLEMYQPGIPLMAKVLSNFFAPEALLVPLIIFFEALLFISLYLLAKKLWGKSATLWTVFLYTCSAIQFRFYWYYYLKNIAALSFLIFAFYFLHSLSYWAIPFSILVVYFHQQTAVFLIGVLLVMFIVKKDERRYYAIVLATTLAAGAIYYLPHFGESLKPLLEPIFRGFLPQPIGGTLGIASGTFYGLKETILFSLLYLPFGLWGAWLIWRQKKEPLLIISFLIALVLVLGGFFLSRRFIPFLDLFLILMAGYGVSEFLKKIGEGRRKKIFLVVYPLALLIFIGTFVYNTAKPLIYEDELREIKMLRETEENAYILVTDQEYMPWVYGWSGRKTIAPGFGEYDIYWTIPEWHRFWESDSRQVEHDLLLKLPKPLYIFAGERYQPIAADFSGDCFERINWRTWKFICEK